MLVIIVHLRFRELRKAFGRRQRRLFPGFPGDKNAEKKDVQEENHKQHSALRDNHRTNGENRAGGGDAVRLRLLVDGLA